MLKIEWCQWELVFEVGKIKPRLVMGEGDTDPTGNFQGDRSRKRVANNGHPVVLKITNWS